MCRKVVALIKYKRLAIVRPETETNLVYSKNSYKTNK